LFGTGVVKPCVFNVGRAFAVDKDGILYAKGAQLAGYADSDTVSDLSTSLTEAKSAINQAITDLDTQYGSIIKLTDPNDKTSTFMTKSDGTIKAVTEGYFNSDKTAFYKESTLTNAIAKDTGYVYVDKKSG
jgi:hypothetical protein